MVVGAAGYELEALFKKGVSENLRVFHDLLAVCLELRLESFAEANCLACDNVHERAALYARENSGVDLLCDVLVVCEYQTASRTSQGLVSGGCNNVSVRNRADVLTSSYQTCNVSHIYHQVRADCSCDRSELREVDNSGICGRACYDELRLALVSLLVKLLVINEALVVCAVGYEVVELTGNVDRRAVGQVTAVCKAHAHYGIAGLKKSHVNRSVSLCA